MAFQRTRALTLLAIATSAIALPAFAQDTQPEATSEPNGDIVVTARRREESLLDVPIAMTAFSGAALEKSGAMDITDISNVTPNTTFENSRGTNSTLTAFIRGVGQQDPVPGFEAGVGLYLDDVYLNRPQASVLDIYDVERIEVLRGPQGTLYGRNTIGGAVKYVTKRLPQEYALKVKGTFGSYKQADGVLTVSAPITDLIRVGGTVARLSRGGFGDNLTYPGLENYNKDVWAGRASVELGGYDEPVFIRIAGDYTRDKSDPRNGHRLIPGLLSGTPVLSDMYDTQAGLNNPTQSIKAYGIGMTAEAQLSDALTFRSISAYRADKSFTPIDFDSLPSVDVDVPAIYKNNQTSQEFQLLYDGSRLHGLVGFYYLDAEASTQFDVILGTTGPLLGIPGLNAYTAGDVKTRTWSAFGDFTFDVTDSISISAGGRWTSDKRRSTIIKQNKAGGASPIFGGNAVVLTTATNFTGSAKFTKFTPRASISFKPDQDNMIYASYSKGFKGGGFDPRGSGTSAPDTNRDGVRSYQEIYDYLLFRPETVDSYEAGYKGSLFDRRLNLAITGFYGQYKNVQVPGSVGVDANGDGVFESFAGITTNAGRAMFKGAEVEANAILARDFAGAGSSVNFNGTLGYIDGKYKTFILNGTDVAQYRSIQNTPKWTTSGTLSATLPVGDGTLSPSTTFSYRSLTHQFETPSPFLDQKAYGLLDASIVYSAPNDRWSLGIHGKNLTDKQYITSGYQYAAGNALTGQPILTPAGRITPTLGREGIATAFYGNPRQVFVTGTVKF
ncbi:MAG: TonB-dependent receptor [Sphingobium sp.]